MINVMRLLSYLPLVLSAVGTVEQLISGRGRGREKKEKALQMVFELLGAAGHPIREDYQKDVSDLADATVGVLNRHGVFNHDEPASAKAKGKK